MPFAMMQLLVNSATCADMWNAESYWFQVLPSVAAAIPEIGAIIDARATGDQRFNCPGCKAPWCKVPGCNVPVWGGGAAAEPSQLGAKASGGCGSPAHGAIAVGKDQGSTQEAPDEEQFGAPPPGCNGPARGGGAAVEPTGWASGRGRAAMISALRFPGKIEKK